MLDALLQWTVTNNNCFSNTEAVKCGTPKNGKNAVPVPAEVDLVFGQEYVYSCLSGYEPASVDMVMVTKCTSEGDFSLQSLPVCKGMTITVCVSGGYLFVLKPE